MYAEFYSNFMGLTSSLTFLLRYTVPLQIQTSRILEDISLAALQSLPVTCTSGQPMSLLIELFFSQSRLFAWMNETDTDS